MRFICLLSAAAPVPVKVQDGLIDILISSYGPIAFGLVALLILWKWIVGPQLVKNDEAAMAMADATNAMKASADTTGGAAECAKDAAASAKSATEAAKATTIILERCLDKAHDLLTSSANGRS